MVKIQWKTLFNGWKDVDEEQAKRLVLVTLNGANVSKEKLIPYLNENRLKGITVEQLMKGSAK